MNRRLPAAAASILGAVALGSTLAAWLQSPPPVTAAEAVSVAEDALEAAGVADAVVDADPEQGSYSPGDEDDRIEVWKTTAAVDGGTIRLWVARSDAEPVFLDDRTPDGTRQILDDSQYEVLARFDADPAFGRHLRRNIWATAAGVAVMALAVALGTRPEVRHVVQHR